MCAPLLLAALVAPPRWRIPGRTRSATSAKHVAIAAGQVERGIAELKQAYAIKPHPDVLYDIAKAYVDLGNIPEALNYSASTSRRTRSIRTRCSASCSASRRRSAGSLRARLAAAAAAERGRAEADRAAPALINQQQA